MPGKTEKIKKDMLIGEVVKRYPDTAMIMMQFGLHCVGCMVAKEETLEEGAKAHGLDDKTIKEMVEKMNDAIKKE